VRALATRERLYAHEVKRLLSLKREHMSARHSHQESVTAEPSGGVEDEVRLTSTRHPARSCSPPQKLTPLTRPTIERALIKAKYIRVLKTCYREP
jgi:hypothetical protein